MRQVPQNVLMAIQQRFHALIRERAGELIDEKSVALPELSELLPADKPKEWLPIPGMYGGFSYWLEGEGTDTKLITESWSRVVDGSGQRHEITPERTRLIDSGFV